MCCNNPSTAQNDITNMTCTRAFAHINTHIQTRSAQHMYIHIYTQQVGSHFRLQSVGSNFNSYKYVGSANRAGADVPAEIVICRLGFTDLNTGRQNNGYSMLEAVACPASQTFDAQCCVHCRSVLFTLSVCTDCLTDERSARLSP